MHEPLSREAGKLAALEAGEFWLVNFECAGSLSLREPLRTNGFSDAKGEVGLRKTFIGVGRTDVGEYVPPAFASQSLIL